MFYYLKGTLALLTPTMAVLDVGGVGYKLSVSGTTYHTLASLRQDTDVKLYTHLAVREDGVELFGFSSEEELRAYQLLTSVSGVGPKAAIAILTLLTPDQFVVAVCSEDVKTLSKASGVGAKTAARVVLELKDKLSKEAAFVSSGTGSAVAAPAAVSGGKVSEALDALTVLGYSRSEAQTALQGLDIAGLELEELIRLSLKKLMK